MNNQQFERHFCVTTYVKDTNSSTFLMIFHKKLQRWLPPGGHIDPNELPEAAAVRECFEETGLKVQLINKRTEVEGGMLNALGIQLNVVKPNLHEHMDMIYLGVCSKDTALVLNSDETTAIKWFDSVEIQSENFNTFPSVKTWVKTFSELNSESNLPDLQLNIKTFCNEHSLQTDSHINLLDILSELGELAKEYLKKTKYGQKQFSFDSNWNHEIGDLMFALICLANNTNVDINSAIKLVLQKYENRIKKSGQPGSESL